MATPGSSRPVGGEETVVGLVVVRDGSGSFLGQSASLSRSGRCACSFLRGFGLFWSHIIVVVAAAPFFAVHDFARALLDESASSDNHRSAVRIYFLSSFPSARALPKYCSRNGVLLLAPCPSAPFMLCLRFTFLIIVEQCDHAQRSLLG